MVELRAWRATPVAVFVSVTWASGTRALLASVTVPVTAPTPVWAQVEGSNMVRARNPIKTRHTPRKILLGRTCVTLIALRQYPNTATAAREAPTRQPNLKTQIIT